MTFALIPAIDVRDRAVVRLLQGDYGRQTSCAPTAIDVIRDYAAQGVSWLHLVDLDAARLGRYTLLPLLDQVVTSTTLAVQTGGGVRHESDVEAILKAGAARVVVGTVTVREPERVLGWLTTFGPDRLTLALDTRQNEHGVWKLPIKGWTESTPHTLESLLGLYAESGLRHVLSTDIARDGRLSGFNVELHRATALRFPDIELQASGGVRDLTDIAAARRAGARAAILGRARLKLHGIGWRTRGF